MNIQQDHLGTQYLDLIDIDNIYCEQNIIDVS